VPVLHDYNSDSGSYLRSNINGQFVTFQIYPSAKRFLGDLGYATGDTVSWHLLRPLWERGYVYTGDTGTSTEVDSYLESSDIASLSSREEKAISEFLDKRERDQFSVPEDTHLAIEEFRDGKLSKSSAKRFLLKANDLEHITQSIEDFRHLQSEVQHIDLHEGAPRYHFQVRGKTIKYVDFDSSTNQYDCTLIFEGGSGTSHVLKIDHGVLQEWDVHPESENIQTDYLRDLIEHLPAVVSTLISIPDYDLHLDLWEFAPASMWGTQSTETDLVDLELHSLAQSFGRSDKQSDTLSGSVQQTTEYGYGTLCADKLDREVIFESVTGGVEFEAAETVKFRLQRSDGVVRAIEITVDKPFIPDEDPQRPEENLDSEISKLIETWTQSKYRNWSRVAALIGRFGREQAYHSIQCMDRQSLGVVQEIRMKYQRLSYTLDFASKNGYWKSTQTFENGLYTHILELHPETLPSRKIIIEGRYITEIRPLNLGDNPQKSHQYYKSQRWCLDFINQYTSIF
jgi:hypothetical protein